MIKFGIDSTDINLVANVLSRALSANFVLHDSIFRGGDYYRVRMTPGDVFLQTNYDPVDCEPFEPSWPPSKLILLLDGMNDGAWDKICDALRLIAELYVSRIP
jgi:hypothetical protein